MKLGFIGLGRMGSNMVLNLLDKKHTVIAYNRSPAKLKPVVRKGAKGVATYSELIAKLKRPRVVWLMVTSAAVDSVLREVVPLLNKGDIVIDGGNSYFKHSIRILCGCLHLFCLVSFLFLDKMALLSSVWYLF